MEDCLSATDKIALSGLKKTFRISLMLKNYGTIKALISLIVERSWMRLLAAVSICQIMGSV